MGSNELRRDVTSEAEHCWAGVQGRLIQRYGSADHSYAEP